MTTNAVPVAVRRVHSLPVPKEPAPSSPSAAASSLQDRNSLEPFFSLELEDPIEDADTLTSLRCPKAVTQAAFDRSFSDLAQYKEQLKHCDTPLHKILQLCCPTSDVCGELNRHLQTLKPQCMDGESVDVRLMAEKLQALGFVCQLWEDSLTRRDARTALRNLRHDFIVCLGCQRDGGVAGFSAPVIVEPMFKQQFRTAYTTDEFETLVKAIPSTFVGPLSKLRAIVSLVAGEMSRAYRARGSDLPPWRSHQALLSLWRPERLDQLESSLALEGLADAATHIDPEPAPVVPPTASISAPASPTAAASATPFAAYAVSPFAAAAASADGGASDTAHQCADQPSSSSAPQWQAQTQAVPVPPRRAAKPVSMLAAALHHTTLRGQYQQDDSPSDDTADQFWGNHGTRREG